MLCRFILLVPLLVSVVLASEEKAAAEQDSVLQPTKGLSDVTFHVLGLPHTVSRDEFSACAFTMKVKRMCSMLKSLGLKSILYANEGSEHDCDKMEIILTDKERQNFYGPDTNWKNGGFFAFDSKEGNELFDERVIKFINKNKDGGSIHFLLITWGYGHYHIARASGMTEIETGVGYPQSIARFLVYESYSFLHVKKGQEQVDYYHAVIPNCYYANEFEGAKRPAAIQGRYVAFVGRIMTSKGFMVALETFRFLPEDYTFHVAGQGNIKDFVPDDHPLHDRVIYHGVLAPKERNDLLIGAEALITPTNFREPFGGVMVEAQMLGTPVITTDHAAMAETVWHGVTGYRCRTLRCFVAAAKEAHKLDRELIAKRANETYNCNRIQYQYEDYFQDVLDVEVNSGWYTLDNGPGHTLDQRKFYPSVGTVKDDTQYKETGSCNAGFSFNVYAWLVEWVKAIVG